MGTDDNTTTVRPIKLLRLEQSENASDQRTGMLLLKADHTNCT